VFPLGVKLKTPDGNLAPNGFQSASNKLEQIEEWWTASPDANIGIDLGRSNLTVLDFDKGEPPAELNLPATLTVKTARGTHVYFSGTSKQSDIYLNGVHIGEVKSAGGYVLAPFSVHPEGPIYTLVANVGVEPLPEKLLEKLAPVREPVDASLTGAIVPRGQHDKTLFRIGCKLRHIGLEEEAIYNALVEVCERRCENYGSDYLDMCRRKAQQACKYPVGVDGSIELNQGPDTKTPITPEQVQLAAETAAPLTITLGDDFLYEEIPPRKILISTISGNEPVIYEQSINQVFAWRGAGKTCLGLGFVRCLATGEPFLNFKSSGDLIPVLYVEGELPDSQFQERWRSIVGDTRGIAYMASIDKQQGHHYVSMATTNGMQKVENTLAELAKKGVFIKVLMLDNISTLFNVKANEEEVWIPIQSWFTSLRSRGITVFFFHHAGKGGLSRSHSKSEDMLDVSIKLEEPEESEVGHLHSLMTFDKARAGLSEKPAEIKLHRTHSPKCSCGGNQSIFFCPGDGVRWEHVPKVSKRDQAFQMFNEGKSIMEAATALDAPEGTVRTWHTKWNKGRKA